VPDRQGVCPLSGAASGASRRGVAHGARLPAPSTWMFFVRVTTGTSARKPCRKAWEALPITTWKERHIWYWGKPWGEPALATRATAPSPCNKWPCLMHQALATRAPCNKGQGSSKKTKSSPSTRTCFKKNLVTRVLIKETPQKEGAFARMAISFCMFLEKRKTLEIRVFLRSLMG